MRRLRLLALGATLTIVCACSAPIGATTEPTATEAAAEPSDATPSSDGPPRTSLPECYSRHEVRHTVPPTIDNVMPYSDRVAIVRVVAEGDAFWNTADGKAPPSDQWSGPDSDPSIFTPYEVEVLDVVAGEMSKGGQEIYVRGGTAGCIDHNVTPRPVLKTGAVYAVVLQPARQADMTRDPTQPSVLEAWPANEDGTVTTALDGVLDRDGFSSAVREAGMPNP